MKFSNKKIVKNCLAQIDIIQTHIKNLDDAVYLARKFRIYEALNQGNIRSKLIDAELMEWRNLFMWGLTLDEKERNDIKALAHARFLEDGMNVAHWLDESGLAPNTWLSSDEEEFRKKAKEYFSGQQERKE